MKHRIKFFPNWIFVGNTDHRNGSRIQLASATLTDACGASCGSIVASLTAKKEGYDERLPEVKADFFTFNQGN